MRIGIIGSGRIGGTLARLFEAAGDGQIDRLDHEELTSSGSVAETLPGSRVVKAFTLADSHRQEPGAAVFNRPMAAPEAERVLRSA